MQRFYSKVSVSELKTYFCAKVDINVLNSITIIAEKWKQSKCPSTKEWKRKMLIVILRQQPFCSLLLKYFKNSSYKFKIAFFLDYAQVLNIN
jgi:hypothetical protein